MSKQENRIYWILLTLASIFVWMLIFVQGFMHLPGAQDGVWIGRAACTGGIGGTVAVFRNFYSRLIAKDLIPRHLAYYLIIPVAGIVTGTIVYSLVFFGLNFVSFFNPYPNVRAYLLLISFIVGSQQGEPLFNWLNRTKTSSLRVKTPSE